MTRRVLVTGATGFVGGGLVQRLHSGGDCWVRAAVRRRGVVFPDGIEMTMTGDLSADADWTPALQHVHVVVHAAARTSASHESEAARLAAFRAANVDGTVRLARQAAAAGVSRLVFISSIKVNGEATRPGAPFRAGDVPQPADAYGVSKYEAEQALLELANNTDMELVIIRPPLVYGPGVKGNFASLVRWLYKGVPLPLGRVTSNLRTLVGLDNLVDLIVTCIEKPEAADHIFLAGDSEDLSTAELLTRMGAALKRPVRLFPVPVWLLKGTATVFGKRAEVRRLIGSLQVDIGKTRDVLNWSPPVSVDRGLQRTARSFLSRQD